MAAGLADLRHLGPLRENNYKSIHQVIREQQQLEQMIGKLKSLQSDPTINKSEEFYLKQRLMEHGISPLQALNEFSQRRRLKIAYLAGSKEEKTDFLTATKLRDRYDLIQYAVVTFCRKVQLTNPFTQEKMCYDPFVGRSEREARTGAARLAMEEIFTVNQ